MNLSLDLIEMPHASNAQRVRVDLIDIGGKRLRSLAPLSIGASSFTFGWDGRLAPHDLAAGLYLLVVRLDGEHVATKPWVYLR